ncbi:MAG TPA: SPOR domain-containing protein, partial [Rhodocyclaceae bacterium]|nr:SPOR domain-containing protein [Rhodocyclaceae bacterium]
MSKSRLVHKQRPQSGNTLIGIFVGLVLGVVIAAGVVWYLNRSNSPFHSKDVHGEKVETPKSASTTPQELPAKPGDKQRFEFYKILPGGQDAAAPNAAAPAAVDPSKDPAATPPAANESFYLQAGAFQKSGDADNLKGKLALIGVEASV